jgi:hypothetical protein
MAYWSRNNGSFAVDPAILVNVGADINVANRNSLVTSDYISLNNEAKSEVPAGLFVATMTNGVDRFLPRCKTKTAVTASSTTTVTLSPYNIFVPGDILHTVEPYVTLTITTVSAAQTVTVTLEGVIATATATTNNTTTTASEVVNAINSTPIIKDRVYALNAANVVYIYAKNGISLYTLTTGGTVTSAALSNSGVMAHNNTAIGTIQSIAYATGIATLTAAATATVPVGANLGVRGISEIKGLHIHAVDFTVIKSQALSLYAHSVGVRTQLLPYFDHTLITALPKLTFGTIF